MGKMLLLAVGLFAVYLANGREIGSGDTAPAKYLTMALIRGDGVYLDRYRRPLLEAWPREGLPYYVKLVRGHYVSSYPIGPAILAVPFTLPQVIALDRAHPGWEETAPDWIGTLAKRSAAAIAALTAVALLAAMRRLGLKPAAAWPAVIAAALGSNLWATASQSPWQHGPAALAMTLMVLLLADEAPTRRQHALAGLAAALLAWSRPIDLAFAVTTALWVAGRHPRRLAWFLAPAAAAAVALLAYNRAFLGAFGGYYSAWEAATFATPFLVGLGGTLFSPNRGLFIFSPWTLVAVAYAPFALASLRRAALLPWLIASLAVHAVFVSTFTIWWAGHSFGPRFWTEAIPLLAIIFGMALARARSFGRPAYAACLLLVGISVAVQGLGVAAYPSSWQVDPTDIDLDQARLWDWRDSELSRCLRECRAYRALAGRSPFPPTAIAVPPADPIREFSGVVHSATPVGTLDRADCRRIEGWAWDPKRPDATVLVDLYDGATLLATVPAGRFRKDLLKIKLGDGKHGFAFVIPAGLRDGATHAIHAKLAGTGAELTGSPRSLSCPWE